MNPTEPSLLIENGLMKILPAQAARLLEREVVSE